MKCPHIFAFISSDLWVSSTIATANDTGLHSGLTYAIGEVSGKWVRTQSFGKRLNFFTLGEIKTAQLEFLGYTVPDQAFSEQNPTMLPSPPPSLSPSCSASYPYIELPSSAGHAGPWTQQWFDNPRVPQ
jgi:hypothetical protein